MKLPVIKKLASDRTISEDDVSKAIKVLEIISDAK